MTDNQTVTSRAAPSRTRLPTVVRVLLVARFVNRLGAFSMSFLAVLLVQEHGASVWHAGLVVGAFGAATIPSRLLGGSLATRLGSKAAVVLGLCGTAGSQLVVALAPTFGVALAGAVLLGLCFEIYEPASQGLIADVTPAHLHPATYGLLGVTLSVAALVAGLIAAAVGRLSLEWLFVLDAATALGCALLVARAMPSTPPHRTESGAGAGAEARPWSDRRLLALMATGTVFATVYLCIPMAIPVALAALGRDPSESGLLAALGAVVVIVAQPILRGAGDVHRRMVGGYLLLAAGLAVAGLVPTFVGYAVATTVIGLGDVLLLGYTSSLVARLAPEGATAAYFAVHGLTWGVALTVGPPLMGLLMGHGVRSFWLTASALMVATGVAHLRLARQLGD